jgi:hypothetical protein
VDVHSLVSFLTHIQWHAHAHAHAREQHNFNTLTLARGTRVARSRSRSRSRTPALFQTCLSTQAKIVRPSTETNGTLPRTARIHRLERARLGRGQHEATSCFNRSGSKQPIASDQNRSGAARSKLGPTICFSRDTVQSSPKQPAAPEQPI